jgi:hypothetical protein
VTSIHDGLPWYPNATPGLRARPIAQGRRLEGLAVGLLERGAIALCGDVIIVVDADERDSGGHGGRHRRPQPRQQAPAASPARRSLESERVDHARLEAGRRLLERREHEELVGDSRELVDEPPALAARREVAQRLGALLAFDRAERDLRSQILQLLTAHCWSPVTHATSTSPPGSVS